MKRALLLYDRLVFLDPVNPELRAAMYADGGPSTSVSQALAQQWLNAEHHYRMLHQHGLIRIEDPAQIKNFDDSHEVPLAALDADRNANGARQLFHTRTRCQVLARRLPEALLDDPRMARMVDTSSRSRWEGGEPIVEVP